MFLFFFFSSRRRHTRWTGDWSSDVCSSDLGQHRDDERGSGGDAKIEADRRPDEEREEHVGLRERVIRGHARAEDEERGRSEERRVGKECRARWWAEQ